MIVKASRRPPPRRGDRGASLRSAARLRAIGCAKLRPVCCGEALRAE